MTAWQLMVLAAEVSAGYLTFNFVFDELVKRWWPSDLAGMDTRRRHAPLWIKSVAATAGLAVFFLIGISGHALAANRSPAERSAFVRENPCPATGQPRGPCPGYVVDHIVPLCAGGADHPSNMQWQSVEDGKRKDRDERRMCRRQIL